MRHGRKSRNQRFDGYKRHVLKDVDLGMVRAVGVTRANQPEAEVTPAIETDLQHQKVQLKELRERQHTVQGRAKLRERVSVEHCLAKIGQWQGEKARYIGLRKNLFDLRRMAIVHNLHVLAQMPLTNSLGQTS
jgi:IS5 family transposase